MTCGIYKIENKINGKVYIGQSINIEKRWAIHKWTCNNKTKGNKSYNYLLYKAMRKYGLENFNFEIINECSKDKLNDLEIKYIAKYNSYIGFKKSNGYNQTIGGSDVIGENNPMYGITKEKHPRSKPVIFDNIEYPSIREFAIKHDLREGDVLRWLQGKRGCPENYIIGGLSFKNDETKLKSITSRNGENNPMFGKTHSEEAKNKIRKARMGTKMPEEQKNKISEFNKGNKYNLGRKASESTKIRLSELRKRGKNPSAKKIVCENKIFPCIKDCAEYYKINYSTLRSYLNGNNYMPIKWYEMGLSYLNKEDDKFKIQHTTEEKRKINSEAHKGLYIKGNHPLAKKIICDKRIFDCIKNCSFYYDANYINMTQWLKGKRKMPQKYIDLGLRYATEEDLAKYPVYELDKESA